MLATTGNMNLVEIAKSCGADVSDYWMTAEFTHDQLRATVEQVCAPLVEALMQIDSVSAWDTGFEQAFNRCVSVANAAIHDHHTLIGDKE